MMGEDIGGSIEVGNGAGDFEDAIVGAGGHVEAGHGVLEDGHGFGGGTGPAGEEAGCHLGVGVDAGGVGEAGGLDFTGSGDAGTDGGGGFAGLEALELGKGDGHDLYLQVYTIGDFIILFTYQ